MSAPAADIRAVAARLRAAGVASPHPEARALVAAAAGVTPAGLVLLDDLDAVAGARRRLTDWVRRREQREPLQHLLGWAGFRELQLAVGPGVFVPRPETELLAGWAVAAARVVSPDVPPSSGGRSVVVVDLCAGSGAIGLSVAAECSRVPPPVEVHLVEADPAALAWCRRNCDDRAAAGDPPVRLHAGDATDPRTPGLAPGSVDVVVSNPPYLPSASLRELPAEVADHDPRVALDGGPDGLAVIRAVVAAAGVLLRAGGRLGIEHGPDQAAGLARLLRQTDRADCDGMALFTDVATHPDLTGLPRFTTASRGQVTG